MFALHFPLLWGVWHSCSVKWKITFTVDIWKCTLILRSILFICQIKGKVKKTPNKQLPDIQYRKTSYHTWLIIKTDLTQYWLMQNWGKFQLLSVVLMVSVEGTQRQLQKDCLKSEQTRHNIFKLKNLNICTQYTKNVQYVCSFDQQQPEIIL